MDILPFKLTPLKVIISRNVTKFTHALGQIMCFGDPTVQDNYGMKRDISIMVLVDLDEEYYKSFEPHSSWG